MSTAKKRNANAMKLRRLERPATIKEHVYNTLRQQLLHNKHNGRLVEKQITDQLGVSRTPVREALSWLASEGLLVATKHGYKVPEFTPEDVLNVFEVRMLLEPTAARQAADNPSDVGLAEMQRAIDEEKAAHAAGAVPPFLRANLSFRENWLKRISNPLLLALLTRAVHSLQAIRFRTLSENAIREFIIERQQALLGAIKAGNADEAERIQLGTVKGSAKLMRATMFPELKKTAATRTQSGAA
jgi:DNA-binding GntR family transcriptional regulator